MWNMIEVNIWPTCFVLTRPMITYTHNNGIKFKTEFQRLQIWADSGGGTELRNTGPFASSVCAWTAVFWKLHVFSTNRSMGLCTQYKMSKLNFFNKPAVMNLGLRSITEGAVNSAKICVRTWTVNFQCIFHTINNFIHCSAPQTLYAWRVFAHFKESHHHHYDVWRPIE